MGIMSFIKDAGEKLFGHKETEAAAQQAQAKPDDAAAKAASAAANEKAGKAIEAYIAANKLGADGLSVEFDGANSAVTVAGQATDQATKEKILLCCGNVAGVTKVNDMMTVATPASLPQESRYLRRCQRPACLTVC